MCMSFKLCPGAISFLRKLTEASIPRITPNEVAGLGSVPVKITCSVTLLMICISSGLLPTSSAEIYLPPKESITFPNSVSSSGVFSAFRKLTTALPPPTFSPARLFLYVIPFESFNTSSIAS